MLTRRYALRDEVRLALGLLVVLVVALAVVAGSDPFARAQTSPSTSTSVAPATRVVAPTPHSLSVSEESFALQRCLDRRPLHVAGLTRQQRQAKRHHLRARCRA